jgi:hypothetical protein
MSLASRAGDLYYSFRFVKLLTTPWEETDAYKLGIIDGNGKRVKSVKVNTPEEKTAYTTFHRLVFNIKRLIEKIPAGKSVIASYAAALFLLREKYNLSDSTIEKIIQKTDLRIDDFLSENCQWFLLEDKRLSPGPYYIKEERLDNDLQVEIRNKDKLLVNEDCYPVGEIFGMDVYKVTHVNSGKDLYVTLGELKK